MENHGYYLEEESKFNRLIIKMKSFIREAFVGKLQEFLEESKPEQDDGEDNEQAQSKEQ